MTDSQIIADFFGNTLGAVFSFLLYIFTEVNLFGISLVHVLWIFIAFMLFVTFLKVMLK